MPDAEGAIERLYEDPDVRDELRDDEANTLLKWAEDQLYQLAEQSTDADFDERAAQFRTLLKGMNRLVGYRATLDTAALNQRLSELAAQAASLAAPGGSFTAQAASPGVPADRLAEVAGQLPALDDAGAVTTLMALLTPGNNAPPPAAPVSEPVSAPESTAPPPIAALPDDADSMLYLPSLTHQPEDSPTDDPTPQK